MKDLRFQTPENLVFIPKDFEIADEDNVNFELVPMPETAVIQPESPIKFDQALIIG